MTHQPSVGQSAGRAPHLRGNVLGDSAGRAWQGRELTPNPFADDDGTTPAQLAAALAFEGEDERLVAVAAVLSTQRLLVPVVAHAHPGTDDAGEVTAHEPMHEGAIDSDDACASAAMVSVAAPDGRSALPVFSSVETLSAWDATARPVPVEGQRAALAAVAETDSLLVLDPAGPRTVLLGRPAVWAVAQQRRWLPSWQDEELGDVAAHALIGITELLGVRLERGGSSELRAVLAVRDGLSRQQVAEVVARAQRALGANQVLTDRVDSLELVPLPVA